MKNIDEVHSILYKENLKQRIVDEAIDLDKVYEKEVIIENLVENKSVAEVETAEQNDDLTNKEESKLDAFADQEGEVDTAPEGKEEKINIR